MQAPLKQKAEKVAAFGARHHLPDHFKTRNFRSLSGFGDFYTAQRVVLQAQFSSVEMALKWR